MTIPAQVPVDHAPVLLEEALAWLSPCAGGVYCDATVGLGGHAEAILERSSPTGRLVGIDRDGQALERARSRLARFGDRVSLAHARFGTLRTVLEAAAALPIDGCLVDLGVSSMQLDLPARGFSFRHEGPLDMRMDSSQGESAADLLRRSDAGELEVILRDLGEERFARKIAAAIVTRRDREDLSTTSALAELVARTVPSRERGKDPATRTFQALRIAVNDELGELERFLADLPSCLRPGGRVVVISFHSLEDRLVKRSFRALADRRTATGPALQILTKHVVVAGEPERARNPRARSAKLRAAERLPS
jgi:16S rRNA (cytosine1402-N4)-methyltransferase